MNELNLLLPSRERKKLNLLFLTLLSLKSSGESIPSTRGSSRLERLGRGYWMVDLNHLTLLIRRLNMPRSVALSMLKTATSNDLRVG
jgi:hypothetical protein